MDFAIRIALCCVCLGACAKWLGWNDAFHGVIGAGLLATFLLVAWAWRQRHRSMEPETTAEPVFAPSPAYSVLRGLITAAVLAGWLALGFLVAEQTPLYGVYYDRGQARLDERLTTLEQVGNYAEASAELRARLQGRMSGQRKRTLAARLAQDLVEAARGRPDPEGRQLLYQEAKSVAWRNGLADELPGVLLDQTERDIAFRHRIEAAVKEQRWKDATTDLRSALKDCTGPDNQRRLAQWYFDLHVAWAMQPASSQEVVELLREALRAADAYGLKKGSTPALLAAIEDEIKRQNQLTDLPTGARAGFTRLRTDTYPPAFIADVSVEDCDGIPIRGLKEPDFRISVGGKPVRAVALADVSVQPPQRFIALAIDRSGSMGEKQGAPLDAAKKGARIFPVSLHDPGLVVEVLAFGHTIQRCCEWTSDLSAVGSALETLTAGGNTALLAAAATALDDLATNNGEKAIVLFTDGMNNVPGPSIDQIVARAHQHAVQIHTIGLRSHDLDVSTLRRLAEGTGGQYLEAASPEEIAERFRDVSRQMRRCVYRLVVTPAALSEPSKEVPIHVRVGGKNEAVASTRLKLGEGRGSLATR